MDEVALIEKWMEEQAPGITQFLEVDDTSIYYVAGEGLHFSLYGNEMVPLDWLNKHRKPEMTNRVIPLTPPGPYWSQREYVACIEKRIGFTAHKLNDIDNVFHYHFPGINCTSVIVGPDGVKRYIDHKFEPKHDWIEQCRQAMLNEENK